MDKAALLLLLTLSSAIFPNLPSFSLPTENSETEPDLVLKVSQPVKTSSFFEEKEEVKEEEIERQTKYEDDAELELGEEKIKEAGEDGKRIKTYKVTFYQGKEYERELISTKIDYPKDKIILKGTKIVWRTASTPDGDIQYWRKLKVWATHYDSKCLGCNEWTATGLRAGKGVIAVDPKVIKLGSRVYIPGYGLATAGDTGGAIKGNIIDLGFDDARTAGWRAQYVDIYLL
ncbi:G5 domain-containing protein [Candidatus Daviesbacteria bacterium]|nr:G5 domain-containing protein [Candidatus Daviesbacteria bacterium]